jgi:hypothetical protein
MHSREWEISGVMIETTLSFTIGVTSQAGRTIVGIACHCRVMVIRFRISMTGCAGE